MEVESKYVTEVYEEIAKDFNRTRFCIWRFVGEFLNVKSSEMLGLDIGCGNGKNILCNPELNIVGVDSCKPLVKICQNKGINVKLQDCCNLKFPTNHFDYAMSIAVFHHLASDLRRRHALKEMIRVIKPGGQGVFSVWSYENQTGQNKMKIRMFSKGDELIPWVRRQDKKTFMRYYYIYDRALLDDYLTGFTSLISIDNIFNEFGNWIVIFTVLP
jgi:tRNA (uracil-5-)-methyltransferase TRM9